MKITVLTRDGQYAEFASVDQVVLFEPGKELDDTEPGQLILMAPAVVGWRAESESTPGARNGAARPFANAVEERG